MKSKNTVTAWEFQNALAAGELRNRARFYIIGFPLIHYIRKLNLEKIENNGNKWIGTEKAVCKSIKIVSEAIDRGPKDHLF